MGRDRVPPLGAGEILLVAPGHRLVQEGEVVGRLDIVAQRLQRPDDDVAMGVPVLDLRIGLEHEPLRPVAPRLRTAGRRRCAGSSFTGASCSSASRNSTGPWQTSRVPQARAGILLQPVRHGEMDHRVMREPGEAASRAPRPRAPAAGEPQAARHVRPDSAWPAPASRRPRHAGGVARRQALGLGRIGQRADDGEAEAGRRAGAQRDVPAAARLPVGVEQLVAADRLDRVGRAGDQMIDRVGIALAPEPVRVGPEGDALARRRRSRPARHARARARRARDGRRPGSGRARPRPRPAIASPRRRPRRRRGR